MGFHFKGIVLVVFFVDEVCACKNAWAVVMSRKGRGVCPNLVARTGASSGQMTLFLVRGTT